MKKLLLFLSIILLGSCTQRGCQRWEKQTQYTERTYQVTLYSGSKPVYKDTFKGIINGEEGTDGFYYFKGDTLIEVSGDYVIKSLD